MQVHVYLTTLLFSVFSCVGFAEAQEREIRVFIALCDNKTQGIIKVGEKIGNGDDPDRNLYWGCDEGFRSVFGKSPHWQVTGRETDVSPSILRRMTLQHRQDDHLRLTVDAYRGSEIKKCSQDFEIAAASGKYALVAYLGHNGLMDFALEEQLLPPDPASNHTDAIVLACASHGYFSPRLRRLGARPVLMTAQLMYPGSFILHDVLEVWRRGAALTEIRSAAGAAYARNQNISRKAALPIFASLDADS